MVPPSCRSAHARVVRRILVWEFKKFVERIDYLQDFTFSPRAENAVRPMSGQSYLTLGNAPPTFSRFALSGTGTTARGRI